MSDQVQLEASAKEYTIQNIGLRFLPYLLGGFFDQLLLGVVIAQTVYYSRYLKTDTWYMRCLVIASVICAFAASICILVWLIDLFVWDFGAYFTIFKTEFVVKYIYIDALTICCVQAFYIYRACRLLKHWWPGLVLVPFSLGSLVFGVIFAIYIQRNYTHFSPTGFDDYWISVLGYGWMAFAIMSDLCITIIIVLGLWRSKTGWAHTDRRIKTIIIHCFEAQVPALFSAICTGVLWDSLHELGVMVVMLHTKIYVLGLLITLNFRNTQKSGVHVSRPSVSRGGDKTDDDVALV